MVGTEIVVPGSISNLGSGFDALSVAVQLYVRVHIDEVRASEPDTLEFDFGDDPLAGENRIEAGFRAMRARVGAATPGLRLSVRSDVPRRAGLGSSGAATVAGQRLYQLVAGSGTIADCLAVASAVEGHPDNAAASLLGGLTVSCQHDDGRATARAWPWPDAIAFVVATPDLALETARARAVLPASVPLRDAVFNLQRALLLVHAIEHRKYGDLRDALGDRWHQPVRAPLVPVLDEALALEHPALLGVCLSGAGPSIVALTDTDPVEVTALLRTLYDRRNLPCVIRTLRAHQPHDPDARVGRV